MKQKPTFRTLYETSDGKQTLNAFSVEKDANGKPQLKENKQIIGMNGKPVIVALNRAARRASKSTKFKKRNGYL